MDRHHEMVAEPPEDDDADPVSGPAALAKASPDVLGIPHGGSRGKNPWTPQAMFAGVVFAVAAVYKATGSVRVTVIAGVFGLLVILAAFRQRR